MIALRRQASGSAAERPALLLLSLALVLAGAVAYWQNGIGPLVRDLPAPVVSEHAVLARKLAASIPPSATVSASTTLYPQISQRAGAYLFPTLRDADYVFVDLSGSPYPGEPGGNFQMLQELLTGREYAVLAAQDGLLLLRRQGGAEAAQPPLPLPADLLDFVRLGAAPDKLPLASFHDGRLEMVDARLVADGEVGPWGPLATLQTVWRANAPLPDRPRPALLVTVRDGSVQAFENQTILWWYPPEQWQPGELVRIDVRGLALREVAGWEARAPLDPPPAAR